ncbi:Histone-lysine N-methyltransferase SETMAR [Habropoda laboriosa]|uniref:Histone-lysine N-methyltransferase SETMAR n=2 Tax=Habropoda laboriosa TaxID=597456 RepID=A0A0L7RFJ7_9HYME|nr:Histone-lysine N-methyltransferase SETMAR [Habropoda laboriosa]
MDSSDSRDNRFILHPAVNRSTPRWIYFLFESSSERCFQLEASVVWNVPHLGDAKLKNGNFDLKDAPRSGRPVEFDEERLNQLLHENSRQTTRELAEKMECSHTAIEKHLHSMGKVQKCGAWVPHALSDNNKNQRATISVGCQNFHF